MASPKVFLLSTLASFAIAMPASTSRPSITTCESSEAPVSLETIVPKERRSWYSQAWSDVGISQASWSSSSPWEPSSAWQPSSAWSPSSAWQPSSIGQPSSAIQPSSSWPPSLVLQPSSTWQPSSIGRSSPISQPTSIPGSSPSRSPTSSSRVQQSVSRPSPSSTGQVDVYKFYEGDGSTEQGWPDQSSWVDFDSMWRNNQVLMQNSCTEFNQANPSSLEIGDVHSAITTVAGQSGVDPRFVLAIVMQESKGCVRAPTTNYGVQNPGLMQDHSGLGSCNDGNGIQNPCPSSEITLMIKDGTEGTATGPGLVQE